MTSVFADQRGRIYAHRWAGTIVVSRLVGGIPSDQRVAEGWIKKKVGADNDDLVREMVAKTMVERQMDLDEATEAVVKDFNVNGFKRSGGEPYIEGRQLKACLKEASNIRWPKRRWGPTSKGTKSFFAEHVFVDEDVLHLGVAEPSGVQQRFVMTWRGTGITYEEYVEDAKVSFHVTSDYEVEPDDWADLWITAERQGIGATRSQGFGTFAVVAWEKVV